MKKIVLILIVFLTMDNLSSAEYNLGQLVIKFTKNSEEYLSVQKSLLSIQNIPQIKSLFGDCEINRYIPKNILKFSNKKRREEFQSTSYSDPIERIYIISFNDAINPLTASIKLSKLDFIEYAEPIYKRYISYIPNDTLYSKQYFLPLIQADTAWGYIKSTLEDSNRTVLVAIVDTGVDYEHFDLQKNIFQNLDEMGIDSLGNDKRSNNIDDDDNGYIDDWRGWDFVGAWSDSLNRYTGEDNNPMCGPGHGTHVTGTIAAVQNNVSGIAGVAINVKYLPLKNSEDNPFSRSVEKGYRGILYAAMMGADVINCSWSGGGYSQAEREIIDRAVELGAVVVAAAGNDSQNIILYPSGYKGVISVAATDSNDKAARFTNYNYSVDVSAPGVNILSTVVGDDYDSWDGTSMASPVASGVVAMIKLMHPELSAMQIGEFLKLACDNIDTLNYEKKYLLGSGRVNLLKAVTLENPQAINAENIRVENINGNNLFMAGDTLQIFCDILGVLGNITDLKLAGINSNENLHNVKFIEGLVNIGNIFENDMLKLINPITFIVPESLSYDDELNILLKFFNADGFDYTTGVSFTVNPSYITMSHNNISSTFNSKGNIGYNDYPENQQGVGFKLNKGSNMLFEGSIMVCRGNSMISDVARDRTGDKQNKGYFIKKRINLKENLESLTAYTSFDDEKLFAQIDTTIANVSINQEVIQYNRTELENVIFIKNDLINKGSFSDSIFTAYYFDWDLDLESTDDICIFDKKLQYAYVMNTEELDGDYIGVKILSNQKINFFAMDNGSTDENNPGVYNGYTDSEKIYTMTGGILRDKSEITDVSMIIGAGPLAMQNNDTIRITYALFAGKSKEELDNYAIYIKKLLPDENFTVMINSDDIEILFPNPLNTGILNINYMIKEETEVKFSIFDLSGKEVISSISLEKKYRGRHTQIININTLAVGVYFVRLETNSNSITKKIIISN